MRQTADGGYIITGNTKSFGSQGIYLIKTDANGETLWTRKYGRTNNDECYAVEQTSDGGYIVAGQIWWSSTDRDAYVIKTDAQGDSVWSKYYSPTRNWDWARDIQQTPDGGYILTGATERDFASRKSDVWLIRTDSLGNEIWSKTFGGGDYDYGHSVQRTYDGGYIIIGFARSFSGNGINDVYLVKTDSGGNVIWTKTYGGSYEDVAFSGQQTPDSGYIVAGFTRSFSGADADLWLLKTNAYGDTNWAKRYGGTRDDMGWSVDQIGVGQYIVTGLTHSFGAGGGDVWLLRVGRLVEVVEGVIPESPVPLLKISPNPFRAKTVINYILNSRHQKDIALKIYDASGRLVKVFSLPGAYCVAPAVIHWDAKDLAAGVYFVELQAGSCPERQKVIKLK